MPIVGLITLNFDLQGLGHVSKPRGMTIDKIGRSLPERKRGTVMSEEGIFASKRRWMSTIAELCHKSYSLLKSDPS